MLVVTQRGWPPLLETGVRLREGEEKDVGALTLKEGEEVYGKVVDGAGNAVVGADVLVGQGGVAGEAYFAIAAGPSGADGSFTVAGFKSGKVIGAARRQAGDPWVIADPQPVLKDMVIALPATFELTLRLSSKSGHAIGEPEFRVLPGYSGGPARDSRPVPLFQNVGQWPFLSVDRSRWVARRPLDCSGTTLQNSTTWLR